MNIEGYKTMSLAESNGVLTATISHGDLNLLDLVMLGELDRLGREVEADPAIKVLVFQSANPEFFVAHADLGVIGQLPPEPPPRNGKLGLVHAVFDRLRTMPKVTIAKIEGRARGGGSELALACDMRFATIGRGVLGQPEVGVGIIPGAGATVRLPQLVGRGRALEIMLGCGDIPADVAERYGYINRALPPEEIEYFVRSLAARIASFPAEAIAAVKEMVATGEQGMEDRFAREEVLFLRAVHSDPAKRRMAAAMAGGMQTPVLERCCFTHIWGPLAGV
ncbi:MAG TPA: enoyl-CoA hydratase/isomerase family protein [Steroidobacteraceae bacterium]|nr:enoyl-CoA hydratase/isomerase family protein [Steroidobacteraceae bacterium]